jgi:general secretion pathway protein A
MDYYRMLGLNKEPFSNTAEPECFFPTRQYATCLQYLELAVRMRRGLNVIIGEIGVGKTTLCRQLILRLSAQPDDRQQIETHLIMDPAFGTPREFLSAVVGSLGMPPFDAQETDWHVKEEIKKVLLRKGVEEKKIVVLIIDEGQKLPDFCLELLREFLNFETDEYKLLQIVIFTQPEFSKILKEHANFADRINHHGFLGPMTSKQTKEMIRYRLMKAADGVPPVLFTRWGLRAIYRATGGYPRKVITLCHQLVLAMIIQQRAKADCSLVRYCLQMNSPARPRKKVQWVMTAAGAVLLVILLSALWNWGNLWRPHSWEGQIGPEAIVTPSNSGVPLETARTETSLPTTSPPATGTSQIVGTPDRKGVIKTEDTASAAVSVISPGTPHMTTSLPTVSVPVEKSTNTAATPDEMPKMLGQLSVRKDGSVLRMIKKIYGTEDLSRLKAVARSNSQIDNINVVTAGKTINFPALPVSWTPSQKKVYRLQVTQKSDLKEAYSLIEHYSADLPAVQLIPYWNSREGLVFAILLKGGGADEATVLNAKAQLPPHLASDAVIRGQWDGDTIFFAHP